MSMRVPHSGRADLPALGDLSTTSAPSMPTRQYRTGSAADIPAAARLGLEGKLADASEDRMQRYFANENRPQYALPPRVLLLAFDDAALIGYVVGHLTRRYDCQGELQWIYVLAEHRRSEVAAELLRRQAEWFVERNAKRVCVSVGDERARSFYRKHGAVELNENWMVWEDFGALLAKK
jgi:GNAT superfamily N-acetyltransferase